MKVLFNDFTSLAEVPVLILCSGEALIDMLPDTNSRGEHVLRPVTGGAAFNTAIALGRLGEDVGLLSGVSTDGFGRTLINDLEEASVKHNLCIRSDRPTTLAVVDLTDGDATYTFYDEGSAGRMIEANEVSPIPEEVSTLLLGGISLIPEPCGDAYENLLVKNSAEKIIYLDPNIRPSFIDDEKRHRDRIKRMIKHSDIVKVSDEDLSWIEPELDCESAIEQWLGDATSIVLLSRGSSGSEAHSKFGVVKADAIEIEVADTVGAGDTFSAGFLASLNDQVGLARINLDALSGSTVQSALTYANKAAAITASRVGADPPWLSELIESP